MSISHYIPEELELFFLRNNLDYQVPNSILDMRRGLLKSFYV